MSLRKPREVNRMGCQRCNSTERSLFESNECLDGSRCTEKSWSKVLTLFTKTHTLKYSTDWTRLVGPSRVCPQTCTKVPVSVDFYVDELTSHTGHVLLRGNPKTLRGELKGSPQENLYGERTVWEKNVWPGPRCWEVLRFGIDFVQRHTHFQQHWCSGLHQPDFLG